MLQYVAALLAIRTCAKYNRLPFIIMPSYIDLFSLPDVNSQIRELVLLIQRNNVPNSEQLTIIAPVLISMADLSIDWDRFCQYTIKKYGSPFRHLLSTIKNGGSNDATDFKAYVYLFLIEFDLSITDPLLDEFVSIRESIESELKDRDDRAGAVITFGMKRLPIQILKSFLNSSDIVNFKDATSTAIEVQRKIDTWRAELSARETQVSQMKDSLDQQRDAFNFVGLYKGFSQLESAVTKEREKQRTNLRTFGVLMLVPALVDIYLIFSGHINLNKAVPAILIAAAAISLTSTLIFMYFFRIVLRDIDSKDVQLMQIRLRMTLCQFVQKYAEYATEVKTKNPDVLAKFENLIFSGIVGTQDKIPSTFDGIEQISALLKSTKEK